MKGNKSRKEGRQRLTARKMKKRGLMLKKREVKLNELDPQQNQQIYVSKV